MSKPLSTGLCLAAVAAAGAIIFPSCTKTAPAPATTVIVQAPAAPTAATANKEETAVTIDEANEEAESAAPTRKSKPEPTERDVEDAAPARKAAKKSTNKLMYYYDRLPAKHFTMFQNGNRRALLKRKGAIVDYAHNFIEIPGSADPKDGDLESLQITLFPNGNEPWCAVSRIVYSYGKTPSALDFYYDSSDGGALRKTADGFFPYKLGKVDGMHENAYLPRKGLDIQIMLGGESAVEYNDPTFRYNRNFRVGEPAFVRNY